jgi:hypothetical protein
MFMFMGRILASHLFFLSLNLACKAQVSDCAVLGCQPERFGVGFDRSKVR